MFARILFGLFIAVPLIEIALFALLGQTIGVLPTLAGVLVTAVVGALVIRWQGLAALRDLQAALGRGELPARQLADAMLIGAAGLLLLLPGYFTDLMGLVLLVPPARTVLYRWLARSLAVRSGGAAPAPDAGLIDLDASGWRDR